MKKLKLILMIIAILAMSIVFAACSNTDSGANKTKETTNDNTQKTEEEKGAQKNEANTAQENKKIQIITTLFPTYDFAKNIVKDKGNVTLLLNSGVEPHSYEPTPKDIVKIEESDIFIYTGDKMEPWAKNLFDGKNTKFMVVDASANIDKIEHDHYDHKHDDHDHDHDDHKHNDDKHDDHDHEGDDPHIWTDPINAITMVNNILEAVKQSDPEHAEFYENNAKEYIAKLEELHKEYESTLKGKDLKIVYGGHFALGYMAKRYDLEYITAYEHFSPDAEPSAKKIAQIKDFVVNNNVKIIYHEEMLSPKIAKMISESTGAKSLELSGLHNVTKEDFNKGVGYIDIMMRNLYNLKEGL